MKPGIILCMCILSSLHLVAQDITRQVDKDYRHFREIYKQEIGLTDSLVTQNQILLHAVSLPDWLAVLPKSDQTGIFAIGISDPGMTQDKALKLAVLRAKIISALLLNPKISSITDNYSNEKNAEGIDKFSTKYINYYRLLAALAGSPEQFEIVKQSISGFGEAIVLLKFSPFLKTETRADSIMVQIEVYQAERQKHNKFEFEEKCEVYGLSKQNSFQGHINIFYYLYHSVNQFSEIVSRYNGEINEFPKSIFRYQSLTDSSLRNEAYGISIKLTNGLWKAYLSSFVQQLMLSSQNESVELSQVADHYSSSSQNFSRELTELSPTYTVEGLSVVNNQLTVICNSENVNLK